MLSRTHSPGSSRHSLSSSTVPLVSLLEWQRKTWSAWTTESSPAHPSLFLSPPHSACPPVPSTVHEQQSAVRDAGPRGDTVLTFFPPAGRSPFSPRGIPLLSDSAACTPAWIPRSHDKVAEASQKKWEEISPFPCSRINYQPSCYPDDLQRERFSRRMALSIHTGQGLADSIGLQMEKWPDASHLHASSSVIPGHPQPQARAKTHDRSVTCHALKYKSRIILRILNSALENISVVCSITPWFLFLMPRGINATCREGEPYKKGIQ